MAPGKNVINRNAAESNVTLSHTYTFDELRDGQGGSADADEYCSCGWPEHMLLPKGTHKGMDFELFVMATDYTVDNVSMSLFKESCHCKFLTKLQLTSELSTFRKFLLKNEPPNHFLKLGSLEKFVQSENT